MEKKQREEKKKVNEVLKFFKKKVEEAKSAKKRSAIHVEEIFVTKRGSSSEKLNKIKLLFLLFCPSLLFFL